MNNGNNSISSFLSTNPSVSQILEFVETQARAIAAEQRKGESHAK